MTASATSIRLLTEDDLAFGQQLGAAAGWNQTEADWRRLLEHEPAGCFLAACGGAPAGTATTTRNDDGRLAWIGMMLVHCDFRRRGLATALLQRCLDYLQQQGTRCVRLDATPSGRHVYLRLGFVDQWPLRRWRRDGDATTAGAALGGGAAPLSDKILATDEQAFGVARRQWLQRLAADSRVEAHEEGYGMLRAGRSAAHLGPLIAATGSAAEQVARRLLQQTAAPVLWDMPCGHEAEQLAASLGFQPVRELIRMQRGEDIPVPRPQWQYAVADLASG